MKKLTFILAICGIVASCSNSGESGSTDTTSADTNLNKIATGSLVASGENGEQLISKSDCLGCHTVDVKLLGPAYEEVAAKYPATDENIDMLAEKIIMGGAGNWGDIPMTPHPAISEGDAKEMVKYILSLKK